MPRIRPLAWANSVAGRGLISDPAGPPSLVITYVLDVGDRVAFIDAGLLERIGVDQAEIKREAFRNVEVIFPRAAVQPLLGTKDIAMIKKKDSYDATRLLAVPAALSPGQELFAVIPDDDTLALVGTSDWLPKLKELAVEWYGSAEDEKKITSEVLRVAPEGISVAVVR